jgi:hypothetical protein
VRLGSVLAAIMALAAPSRAAAQAARTYEQTYLAASHNWAFRDHYPAADRLFNAFDYGHAILSETLLTDPAGPPARLDTREFAFITRRLLRQPPGVPLEERAIAPTFTRLVPELAAIFSWAHMLHRQIYDIWADERIAPSQKDAAVADVVRYYRSRHDLALSGKPKSMALMDGREYSGAFRQRDPTFNGLIWSYHWLQVALYDVLIAGATPTEKRNGVTDAVGRFRSMLDCAPEQLPEVMPMTPAVAPLFTARYPAAAAIFDNLHALHDVVSDILISPSIPRNRKRAALLAAAAAYRDSTVDVIDLSDWQEMSRDMDVQRMGGRAIRLASDAASTGRTCSSATSSMSHKR